MSNLEGIRRIALFGPGLIGGSLALALRNLSPQTHLTICGRNAAVLEEVLRRGLADEVTDDLRVAASEADLIILCTPVGVMEGIAATIAPYLRPEALVTDAGSVKACVAEKLTKILGDRFLGGHPMAGSERSGLAAAQANLFQGAPCILTPLPSTPITTVETVSRFWTALGTRIFTMSPQEHDRLVSRISHLPHVMAFALVHLIAGTLPENASQLAGGSYRDGTRVASSDPSLWTGIFEENRSEIVSAVREMASVLNSFAQDVESAKTNSILDFLTRAKEYRDRLPLPPPDEPL